MYNIFMTKRSRKLDLAPGNDVSALQGQQVSLLEIKATFVIESHNTSVILSAALACRCSFEDLMSHLEFFQVMHLVLPEMQMPRKYNRENNLFSIISSWLCRIADFIVIVIHAGNIFWLYPGFSTPSDPFPLTKGAKGCCHQHEPETIAQKLMSGY